MGKRVSSVGVSKKSRSKPQYMEAVLRSTMKAKWWQKFGSGVHMDLTAKMILLNLWLSFCVGEASVHFPLDHEVMK